MAFQQIQRPGEVLYLPICEGCGKAIRSLNGGILVQDSGYDGCHTFHKRCASRERGDWLPLSCLLRLDQRPYGEARLAGLQD